MTSLPLEKTKKETLLEDLARTPDSTEPRVPHLALSDPDLEKLRALGTELWLDTGDYDEAEPLWRREVSALTTNNTLVNQVVQSGRMDKIIHEAVRRIRDAEPKIDMGTLVLDVGFVVNSRIARSLSEAFDAYVSVELHPAISEDIDRTVRYARRYHAVNPDRFIVKIPLTPEGYCAVAQVQEVGIPVNFTLGFSARQNYLAALISRPSYVNVFLGRLNSVVAQAKLGDGEMVGEKVTLASQKAVRDVRDRYPVVPTKQIAASLRSAEQILSLAGVDVMTVPPKVMNAFLKEVRVPESIKSRVWEQYDVTLSPDADPAFVEPLWTVDDNFREFADDLNSRGAAHLNGSDIREADRDYGTRLFADFTPQERKAIQVLGKIPDVPRWSGKSSLDTMMTEAALQTFAKDQQALDDYILRLASV